MAISPSWIGQGRPPDDPKAHGRMQAMREGLAAMRGAAAAIRSALMWFYDLLEGDRAGRQIRIWGSGV